MARITVEDCLEQIPNRFQLVLAATYRARMLSQGHAPRVECQNKPAVTALREIAEGKVARLNGYVHQLAAVDKRMDTDFVSLIIRFVDEDPEKLEDLSRFIARFQP